MLEDKVQPAIAGLTFKALGGFTRAYRGLSLPVLSTGRPFSYYRKIFFNSQSDAAVLRDLHGQCVLDIGCGLTPYASDSMFQACHQAGMDFYGIDPKLAQGFKLGAFDRIKIMATGGGKMNADAAGLDKGIATLADDLPFEDESVDLILSCYLLLVWIDDEEILESIFREFYRVLKPGAKVKIFPAPHYDTDNTRRPGLQQIMRGFEVEQEFFAGLAPMTQIPPVYMRTMHKQA